MLQFEKAQCRRQAQHKFTRIGADNIFESFGRSEVGAPSEMRKFWLEHQEGELPLRPFTPIQM